MQKTVWIFIIGAIGIALSGYFVGDGLKGFRSVKPGAMTVKGLAEKYVRSDFAIWRVEIAEQGHTIQQTEQKFNRALAKVLHFLNKQGFKNESLQVIVPTVEDLTTRHYQYEDAKRPNYAIKGGYIVETSAVEKVPPAINHIPDLLKEGVSIQGGNEYQSNPKYLLRKFNDYRGELLQEATNNARSVAEDFAKNSGAKVGTLQNASQGVIETYGADGTYGGEKNIDKMLRVVSTLTFELLPS